MNLIKLTIGGQEREFHFGLGFLGNLLESENIDFTEIDAKMAQNPFKWIPLIMYYSCAFGYKRKNEFAPFDTFDFAEWIDEIGLNDKVVTDFFEAFRLSLTKDVPESKDVKKKVTKK
jgi:hypothetical protein